MEIRRLTEADAEEWWRLRVEALDHDPRAFGRSVNEHGDDPLETIRRRFRNALTSTLNLGAFDGGQLVGKATFMMETAEKEKHKGRVYAVYVSDSHRGRGVGRAVMERLIAEAKNCAAPEQILLAVAATQTAAAGLYRSLGFEKWGTEPAALKVGGDYVDEDHMILRIRK
jgi:ribosomal protein S18 acetylase RimI-like enzyme